MVYKAIGLMSGSSLDGLDIVFAHFQERGKKWSYEIIAADCYPYDEQWYSRLQNATSLPALEYLLLHTDYGHYLGESVLRFIEEKNIHLQVDMIGSHGHTTYHLPDKGMTAQLGDGAALAADTGVAVISDLRSLDIALGGQGAPLVPKGEELLFPEYDFLLNIGGIANISFKNKTGYTAFDVCPANRVLNLLAGKLEKPFDEDGQLAANGQLDTALLESLKNLPYYREPWPKSLANEFGTDVVFPLTDKAPLSVQGKLRTYVEHIAEEITRSAQQLLSSSEERKPAYQMLVTGGGAFNTFLIRRLRESLASINIEVIIPDPDIVKYKEALIMALLGVLRWREEYSTLPTVTGARRESIGGALWLGQAG